MPKRKKPEQNGQDEEARGLGERGGEKRTRTKNPKNTILKRNMIPKKTKKNMKTILKKRKSPKEMKVSIICLNTKCPMASLLVSVEWTVTVPI